jgi:tRNA-Thr(GGU) m(6)t(6)A37 methyltransferase TsaA
LVCAPIGVIRSPYCEPAGTPIQPVFADTVESTADILPQYAEGLQDLAGFERIWLIYWLNRAPAARLRVVPFRDTAERGVFATRAPCRPNPIGLSCVQLLGVRGNVVTFRGADILDGTPLLDLKPYVSQFDAFPIARAGWLDSASSNDTRADDRFAR